MKLRCVYAALAGVSLLASAPSSPTRVPFEPADGLISVAASIGGSNVRMLVDLGAGFDIVSGKVARRVGLDPTGRYTGWRMQGDRVDVPTGTLPAISIGSFTVDRPIVGVWEGLDGSGLDGLISALDFRKSPVTFDYARDELTFETPDSLAKREAAAVTVPLALRDDRGLALELFARFDFGRGVSGLCVIDTGSQGIFLDTRFAKRLGINLDDPNHKRTRSGRHERVRAEIPEFRLTGDTAARDAAPRAAIFTELVYDCNVGNEFWKDRWFTLDIPNRVLYVERV